MYLHFFHIGLVGLPIFSGILLESVELWTAPWLEVRFAVWLVWVHHPDVGFVSTSSLWNMINRETLDESLAWCLVNIKVCVFILMNLWLGLKTGPQNRWFQSHQNSSKKQQQLPWKLGGNSSIFSPKIGISIDSSKFRFFRGAEASISWSFCTWWSWFGRPHRGFRSSEVMGGRPKSLCRWIFPSQMLHGAGIFTYIYLKNGPNVCKYSIHGASGHEIHRLFNGYLHLWKIPTSSCGRSWLPVVSCSYIVSHILQSEGVFELLSIPKSSFFTPSNFAFWLFLTCDAKRTSSFRMSQRRFSRAWWTSRWMI